MKKKNVMRMAVAGVLGAGLVAAATVPAEAATTSSGVYAPAVPTCGKTSYQSKTEVSYYAKTSTFYEYIYAGSQKFLGATDYYYQVNKIVTTNGRSGPKTYIGNLTCRK